MNFSDNSDISEEFALARNRIAIEAAQEARRRQAVKEPHDQRLHVVSSIGRGSSASDAIHQRDQRPIWKQGYGDTGNSSDDESCQITYKRELVFPMSSIAEHAAATGRSKAQLLWGQTQDEPMHNNNMTSKPIIDASEDEKTNQIGTQSNKDSTIVIDS